MVFIISMLLYCYDRCLLEQDISAFAVRSTYISGEDVEQRRAVMESELEKWYREKYIWMDAVVDKITLQSYKVELKGKGCFRGGFWKEAEVKRQVYTLSSTFLLRQKAKLEKVLGEEETADEDRVH